jgi:hypothetical protein
MILGMIDFCKKDTKERRHKGIAYSLCLSALLAAGERQKDDQP